MFAIRIDREIKKITLRGRIVRRIKVSAVVREHAIGSPHVRGKEKFVSPIASQFLRCLHKQRTSGDGVMHYWPVAQKIIQRGRNVGERRYPVVIVNETVSHLLGQVDDQGYTHDFRENRRRMTEAAEFSGCVAMIRGENDDTAVIKAPAFKVAEERANTIVDLMYLQGNPSVKSRGGDPVCSGKSGITVVCELMNVLGLGVKQHRSRLIAALIE